MNITKQKLTGFTIVELLIVIVVIGILAALVLNSFSGAQARARDATRKHDITELKKALKLYATEKGHHVAAGSGCGWEGNGDGLLGYDYDNTGPFKPLVDCLLEGGYLSSRIVGYDGAVECGGSNCKAYIKYTCSSGTYLYASLETVGHTGTEADGTCAPDMDTTLGMNYVVRVD